MRECRLSREELYVAASPTAIRHINSFFGGVRSLRSNNFLSSAFFIRPESTASATAVDFDRATAVVRICGGKAQEERSS